MLSGSPDHSPAGPLGRQQLGAETQEDSAETVQPEAEVSVLPPTAWLFL